MLDLATGNGIVALGCQKRAQASRKTLRIDAVDAADIQPGNRQQDDGNNLVQFHGGVQLENLPFEDGAFAAVVSQFGFEYADESPAVAEAARVLSGQGHLCLVVHAHHGAVSKDIAWRVKRLEAVLSDDGVVGRLMNLLRAYQNKDADTLDRESLHLPVIVALTESLTENAPSDDSASFYANEFLRLWNTRDQHSSEALLRSAEKGWSDASGTAIRQKQMLEAARSEEDINRIRQGFVTSGLKMDHPKKIMDYRRNIQNAWLLRGTKN